MAFKRTLKRLKAKLGAGNSQTKLSSKKTYLRTQISKTDHFTSKAKQGRPVIHKLSLLNKEEEISDQQPQVPVFVDSAVEVESVIVKVAKHVDKFHRNVVAHNSRTVADKLKRELQVPDIDDGSRLQVGDLSEELRNKASSRSNLLSGFGLQLDQRHMSNEVNDYVVGTTIYFGASVALQARHGGFLSFNNSQDIKASAHKILPQTKFVIVNSTDLTNTGAMRYGDAVWLQAGQHEVLGANYIAKADSKDKQKRFRPALINCRRENIFKAQQYGRWIILNKEAPRTSIGELVLHRDKIILEQEWYVII